MSLSFAPSIGTLSHSYSPHIMLIGELRKHPTIFHWPIKALIKEWNIVNDEEALALTNFVERCLQLDPGDRPTANDLLSDPWFDDIS